MPVVRLHRATPLHAAPRSGGGTPRLGRIRAVGAAGRLALVGILIGTTVFAGSGGVGSADALVAPACTYGDVLTRYRNLGDWYRTMLDTKYKLSSTYAPVDLVPVTRSGVGGSGSVRRIAIADLAAMFRAAKANGTPFAVTSAYRSYSNQVATFAMWVRREGYAAAIRSSARPGHSEHQLGTTLDLKTPGGAEPWNYVDWGATKTGAWLARNSWRYGWILSYPRTKSPGATCYKYEPWHFRYFGRTVAATIQASRLAEREWLFVRGATGTWTGGLPAPTPTPTPAPSATPAPSDTPSPSDAPSPSADPGTSSSPDASPPSDSPSAQPPDPAAASPSPVIEMPSPTRDPTPSPTAGDGPAASASPSPGASDPASPGASTP